MSSLKDLFPHVYLINLDKAKDRYVHTKGELDRHGLSHFKRVRAYDGRTEEKRIRKDFPDIPFDFSVQKKKLLAEQGTSASHLSIWKEVVEKKLKWALVFEDDAELVDGFEDLMREAMKNKPDDFNFANLSHQNRQDRKGCQQAQKPTWTNHKGVIMCAYVITLEGAEWGMRNLDKLVDSKRKGGRPLIPIDHFSQLIPGHYTIIYDNKGFFKSGFKKKCAMVNCGSFDTQIQFKERLASESSFIDTRSLIVVLAVLSVVVPYSFEALKAYRKKGVFIAMMLMSYLFLFVRAPAQDPDQDQGDDVAERPVEREKGGGKRVDRTMVYFTRKNGKPNLGDTASPEFIRKLTGHNDLVAKSFGQKPSGPKFMSIGSILVNSDERTIVWGSGFIAPPRKKIAVEKVYGVRGPKTRNELLKMGIECPEKYGDPFLLAPLVYPVEMEKRGGGGTAVVAHYSDNPPSSHARVSIETSDAQAFVNDIAKYDKIYSSSLHGIVFAIAYGIPCAWLKLSDDLVGDEFKFYDFLQSIGAGAYKPATTINPGNEDVIPVKKEVLQKLQRSLIQTCPLMDQKRKRELIEKIGS